MNYETGLQRFVHRSRVAAPASAVFAWHTRDGAFERLQPPWEDVVVLDRGSGLTDGSRTVLQLRVGPLKKHWVAEHQEVCPGESFVDIQRDGPFSYWRHRHSMVPDGSQHSWLEDQIDYRLPLGWIGKALGARYVRRQLERVFRYRHDVTINDVGAQQSETAKKTLRLLLSGTSGLIGRALVPLLTTSGHDVVRLVRDKSQADRNTVVWQPSRGLLPAEDLEGFDAVVHLAGENIAEGRWTAAKKKRILESRVEGTRLLCETLSRCDAPPSVVVSASAVGIYGDRGSETLDEASATGSGFLAEVCQAWENATKALRDTETRVVNMRIGVVLSPTGGALKKMLLPFRLGAGGPVGSGQQMMSWITVDDLACVALRAINDDSLQGPVNAVSPAPVSNREFSRTLGRVLGRPAVLPMPSMAARLAFGELANELLLASQCALPAKLLDGGFKFRYPELGGALRHLLGCKEP